MYRIEPWGDDWMQAGTIAAASVAPWTKKKITPEHFIPKARVPKTAAEIERQMNQWARMHNARIDNGHNRQN